MTAKTVIKCDGNRYGKSCESKEEFDLGRFVEGDLPTWEWSYDSDNEFYYCPKCVKRMIASGELEEQDA